MNLENYMIYLQYKAEKVSADTIANLGGLLKEYVDSVESLVDVIKDGRENIS